MWNPFKKRPSQPPQPQKPETPDYPTLFEELTEIVKGGATGDEVEVWMKRRGVDESGLVRWLAGYVGEVKRSRSDEGKVLEALQGLSEVARGDLGRMAREFATYLQGSETEVDSEASEEEEAGERSNLSEVQKFNELLSQMGTSQPVSTNFQELDRRGLEMRSLSYQEWFNLGNALLYLGRLKEALDSFDKALQIQPDDHEAWNNRGFALSNLGRLEEAIASYDKALQIQPDFHLAWFNRGIALGNLGKLEEAIASYDQALQIQPDNHQVWVNRGNSI
ncbi:MAG: tetratricopeptide repeat protein [Spirulina sp.]